ncbi:MAG: hypothetical protein LKI24_11610 [Acidipropionibacterium sp.]|nr:hypothetical protein [Acidipropionibacterium sp.]
MPAQTASYDQLNPPTRLLMGPGPINATRGSPGPPPRPSPASSTRG